MDTCVFICVRSFISLYDCVCKCVQTRTCVFLRVLFACDCVRNNLCYKASVYVFVPVIIHVFSGVWVHVRLHECECVFASVRVILSSCLNPFVEVFSFIRILLRKLGRRGVVGCYFKLTICNAIKNVGLCCKLEFS